MFWRLPLFCALFAASTIKTQDLWEQWTIFEQNDIKYKVRHGKQFTIESLPTPILTPKSIANILHMESLTIFNTDLEEIQPGTFQNLPKLKRLQIISNYKLKTIEAGVFNNLNVTQLELTYAYLPNIASDAFDNMTSLELIFMYDINLREWNSEWFTNTPSLKEIYVNFNLIQEIPANAFKNLEKRHDLTISFYHNKIKRVDDDAFKGLKRISILTIAENEIESLNGSFLQGVEVGVFRIRNNKIRCVEEENLSKIFVADLTDIRGNPWETACLEKLKKWCQIHNKSIKT